eukprot:g20783.t1
MSAPCAKPEPEDGDECDEGATDPVIAIEPEDGEQGLPFAWLEMYLANDDNDGALRVLDEAFDDEKKKIREGAYGTKGFENARAYFDFFHRDSSVLEHCVVNCAHDCVIRLLERKEIVDTLQLGLGAEGETPLHHALGGEQYHTARAIMAHPSSDCR